MEKVMYLISMRVTYRVRVKFDNESLWDPKGVVRCEWSVCIKCCARTHRGLHITSAENQQYGTDTDVQSSRNNNFSKSNQSLSFLEKGKFFSPSQLSGFQTSSINFKGNLFRPKITLQIPAKKKTLSVWEHKNICNLSVATPPRFLVFKSGHV